MRNIRKFPTINSRVAHLRAIARQEERHRQDIEGIIISIEAEAKREEQAPDNVSRPWERAKHLPELRLLGYLDKLIPDVPLTPELKLYSAIFGEQEGYVKSRLIQAYIAIHPPKGDWEDYKKNCTEWVTSLLQESIRQETEPIKEPIPDILEKLTIRERGILRLRFGFEGKSSTLAETGAHYGVSRERIRQIEALALRKLRHPSRSRLLKQLNPGEWLRARVFLECEQEVNWPALFPFWIADRRRVKYLNKEMSSLVDELREVEGLEGYSLAQAISMLKRQTLMMRNQINFLRPLVEEKLHQPITEVGWSQRVVHALTRYFGRAPDVPTVDEVAMLTDDELMAIRNFGQKCLAEVRETFKSPSV